MTLVTKEMKVIIRIIILVTTTATIAVSANIDCEGKAFHCVNSTHFMICVDFGAGVSSTLGNYLIPCPPSTECRKTNKFECEFPKSVPSSVDTSVNKNNVLIETTTAAVTGPVKLFLTAESASASRTINTTSGLSVTQTPQTTIHSNQNIAGTTTSDVQFSLDFITVSTIQDNVTEKSLLRTASDMDNNNAENNTNTTSSDTVTFKMDNELTTGTGNENTISNISTIQTVTYGITNRTLNKAVETTKPSYVNVTNDFKSPNIFSSNDTLVSNSDTIDYSKAININNTTINNIGKKNNTLVSSINDNFNSTISVNGSTLKYNNINNNQRSLENTKNIFSENISNISELNIKSNTNSNDISQSDSIGTGDLSTLNFNTILGNILDTHNNHTVEIIGKVDSTTPFGHLNTSRILNSNFELKSSVNNTFLLNKTNVATNSNFEQTETMNRNNSQILILNGNEALANITLPTKINVIQNIETTTEDINKATNTISKKPLSPNRNAVLGNTSNNEQIVGGNNIVNTNNLTLNNSRTPTIIDSWTKLSNANKKALETTTEFTINESHTISKQKHLFNNNTYNNEEIVVSNNNTNKDDLILSNTEPLTYTNISQIKNIPNVVLVITTESIKNDTSDKLKETRSVNINVNVADFSNTEQIADTYNNENSNNVNSKETNATNLVFDTVFKDLKNNIYAISNQTVSIENYGNAGIYSNNQQIVDLNNNTNNVTLNSTERLTFDISSTTSNATDNSAIYNQTLTLIANSNIKSNSNMGEIAGPNNNMNINSIFLNSTEMQTNISISPQKPNATNLVQKVTTEGIENDTLQTSKGIFSSTTNAKNTQQRSSMNNKENTNKMSSNDTETPTNNGIMEYHEKLDSRKPLNFDFGKMLGVNDTYLLNHTNVGTEFRTDLVNNSDIKSNKTLTNTINFPTTNNAIDIILETTTVSIKNVISNKTLSLNSNEIVGNISNIEEIVNSNSNVNTDNRISNNTVTLINKYILSKPSNANNFVLETITGGIKNDTSAKFSVNNNANIGSNLKIEQSVAINKNVNKDNVTLNNNESLTNVSAQIRNGSDFIFRTRTEGITYDPSGIANQANFNNNNNASIKLIASTNNNTNTNLNGTETQTAITILPSITKASNIKDIANATNGISNKTGNLTNSDNHMNIAISPTRTNTTDILLDTTTPGNESSVISNQPLSQSRNSYRENKSNINEIGGLSTNVKTNDVILSNNETLTSVDISSQIINTTDLVLEVVTSSYKYPSGEGIKNDTWEISKEIYSYKTNNNIGNNSNIEQIASFNDNDNNTETLPNIIPLNNVTNIGLESTTEGIKNDTQSYQNISLNSYANITNDLNVNQIIHASINGNTNDITINNTEQLFTNNRISSPINSATAIVLGTTTIGVTNEVKQINSNVNTNNTELLKNITISTSITNATNIVLNITTENMKSTINTIPNTTYFVTGNEKAAINANDEKETSIKDTNNQILNSTVTSSYIGILSSIDNDTTVFNLQTTTEIINKVTNEIENLNNTHYFNTYNQTGAINIETNNKTEISSANMLTEMIKNNASHQYSFGNEKNITNMQVQHNILNNKTKIFISPDNAAKLKDVYNNRTNVNIRLTKSETINNTALVASDFKDVPTTLVYKDKLEATHTVLNVSKYFTYKTENSSLFRPVETLTPSTIGESISPITNINYMNQNNNNTKTLTKLEIGGSQSLTLPTTINYNVTDFQNKNKPVKIILPFIVSQTHQQKSYDQKNVNGVNYKNTSNSPVGKDQHDFTVPTNVNNELVAENATYHIASVLQNIYESNGNEINLTTKINYNSIMVDDKQNITLIEGSNGRTEKSNNTISLTDTTSLNQRNKTFVADNNTIIKNINNFTNISNHFIVKSGNLTVSNQEKIDEDVRTVNVTLFNITPIESTKNKTMYNSSIHVTTRSSQSTVSVNGSNSTNEYKLNTVFHNLSSPQPSTNKSDDKIVFYIDKPASVPLNVEQSSQGLVNMTVSITTPKLNFQSNIYKLEQEAFRNADNMQHLSNFTISNTKYFKNAKENITQMIDKENKQVNIFEKTSTFENNGTKSSIINITNEQVDIRNVFNVLNISHNNITVYESLPNSIKAVNKGNVSGSTTDIHVTKDTLSDSNTNRKQNTGRSFNCFNRKRGRYSNKKDCSIYYICIGRLEPVIGKCPENTVFSEISKHCTKNRTHCVHSREFKCTLEGRFSDIFNKNSYFICVANGKSFIRFKFQCQNGYYLDRISVKCIKESDLESQKQVSFSTDNSKSESSMNDEIDDENFNLEYSSNGDANYFRSGFRCVKEGKFSDSNDCRKYYVCTKTNNLEFRRRIKKCDKDEVFHKDKKKCVDDDDYDC